MSDDMVTIGRFIFPHEAHLLRMRLAGEGIEAFVIGEHSHGYLGVGRPDQVRVQVRAADVDDALEVLERGGADFEGIEIALEDLEHEALTGVPGDAADDAAWPGPEPAPQPEAPPTEAYTPPAMAAPPMPYDGTMRCPSCGVGNVHRRRLGPLLKLFGVLLLGVPLIVAHNTWECDICGHRWRPD